MQPSIDPHRKAHAHLLAWLKPVWSQSIWQPNRIRRAFRAGGKVLLCGNGGGAADCQHMAAEFVSRLTKDFDRPGLPAVAVTTDSSFLTSFAVISRKILQVAQVLDDPPLSML